MVLLRNLRANGLGRAVLGAAIAGLGTCALAGYLWWSARGGGVSASATIVILGILLAIGATAGLISGRFRDAAVSWAAAVLGAVLVYQANYAIDPGWPRSETPFEAYVLLAAVFLLPFVAGGHLLGTLIANRTLQRTARPTA
jgi:uncharacterized membrane protein YhaH (DUF805 family)